jgi:GT2 family glycosyltransferase
VCVMSSSPPFVSVLSLTHNRKENILALLKDLVEQDYPTFEVIVIDNASDDGTAEMVTQQFPEVVLVQAGGNYRNYSYNLGLEHSRGEFLLIIDDDGLPADRSWISEMVGRFVQNPRLGAIACTIRMQDTGKIAEDSPQFVPDGNKETGYLTVAYNGTGAGLRSAAIKPFMPIYPIEFMHSWNELYLCTKLLDAGWQVCLFPDIVVWHCRPTGSSNPPMAYYGLRNYIWYLFATYPFPELIYYLSRHVINRLKLACRGKIQIGILFSAWFDAIRDILKIDGFRKPVSRETIRYITNVRRYGNWDSNFPDVVME